MYLLIVVSRGSGIGHGADVRLDRAKRIVLAGDTRRGQRVEQRALADVRQSDDACFHDQFLASKRQFANARV